MCMTIYFYREALSIPIKAGILAFAISIVLPISFQKQWIFINRNFHGELQLRDSSRFSRDSLFSPFVEGHPNGRRNKIKNFCETKIYKITPISNLVQPFLAKVYGVISHAEVKKYISHLSVV